MERLDVFYKAYDSFRTIINEDSETPRFRKFCAGIKNVKAEDLVVSYSTVEIDEEWVKALEKGLVYVEKAIKEDRQFIRNEGEVLPIEKIRRTSKAGIQDLAKHSNYISRMTPEDADSSVIPDKMLMIQREADYSIYENRVVYALLAYLKEFITVRLEAIKRLANSFEFSAYANKDISFGDKKLQYSLNIHEVRENDPTMAGKNSARDVIERLDKCFTLVMSFLKTPLMVEVGKSELVSRPITKTNVLRMNTNFRESLALFDYIAEYDGPGYTVKKIEKKFNPFGEEHENSMTDIIAMTSFITYMYGNDLAGQLKENLKKQREEEAIKEQERILKSLQAFELKGKADMKTIEEYFEDFVEGYKIIEKKCQNLEEDLAAQKLDTIRQLNEQKADFDKKLMAVKEEHEIDLTNQKNLYEKQLFDKDEEYSSRIDDIKEEAEKHLSEVVAPLNEQISALSNEKADLIKQNKTLSSENTELEARVQSLLISSGQASPEGSYTAKEEFDRLEQLKKDFDAYFKKAWALTKEAIRKENIKIDKDYKKHKAEEKARALEEKKEAENLEKEGENDEGRSEEA